MDFFSSHLLPCIVFSKNISLICLRCLHLANSQIIERLTELKYNHHEEFKCTLNSFSYLATISRDHSTLPDF